MTQGPAIPESLKALLGQGVDTLADGSGLVRCPAHDGRQPSLAIRQGSKGVVIRCHAGCSTEEILDQLGLTLLDLVNSSLERNETDRQEPARTAR